MKRSNPSTVVGGGEMNRATSSCVSSSSSARGVRRPQLAQRHSVASEATGSIWRQSVGMVGGVSTLGRESGGSAPGSIRRLVSMSVPSVKFVTLVLAIPNVLFGDTTATSNGRASGGPLRQGLSATRPKPFVNELVTRIYVN